MARPPRLLVLAILAVLAQPIPGRTDDRPVADTLAAPVLAPHGMVVSLSLIHI